MSEEYKDRFSDAAENQQEKSAFICQSCKKRYDREGAKKSEMTCCGRTLTELMQEGFGP